MAFGARPPSTDMLERYYVTPGYVELCCSPTSPMYQRVLPPGAYGTYPSEENVQDILDLVSWPGDNTFCYVCFNSGAYIDFYLLDCRNLSLEPHGELYLTRITAFYESPDSPPAYQSLA